MYESLEKYWVTQNGCFILETTEELGMGITYTKILLCNGISDKIRDKKIIMRE